MGPPGALERGEGALQPQSYTTLNPPPNTPPQCLLCYMLCVTDGISPTHLTPCGPSLTGEMFNQAEPRHESCLDELCYNSNWPPKQQPASLPQAP